MTVTDDTGDTESTSTELIAATASLITRAPLGSGEAHILLWGGGGSGVLAPFAFPKVSD